jgi:hypothetical protein
MLTASVPHRTDGAFACENGDSAIREAIETAAQTLVPQLVGGRTPASTMADAWVTPVEPDASPVLPATGLVLPIPRDDGTLGAVVALAL